MPSDLERIKAALEGVRYRPGWTITAHPCPFSNHVWVLIDAEVPDAEKWDHDLPAWRNRSRDNMTRIGVRAVVPDNDNHEIYFYEHFYNWLAWRLKRIERHESREFFWVDGKPWDSPHKTPQPEHDYLVRKVRDHWEIQHPDGSTVLKTATWGYAYQVAWRHVINDDLAKGDEMING
jgi:hypothetical protein